MADPITPSRGAAFDNTAPGSKTPALAAAFDNTLPSMCGVANRVVVLARQATNLSSFSTCTKTIDGQSLEGTYATRLSRLVFLNAQTNAAQNGIYEPKGTGTSIDVTGTYDAITGTLVKSGLTTSRLYYFTKNTAGTSVSNGTTTLTENGFIAPGSGGDLTFTGTPGASQLNFLVEAQLGLTSAFDEPNEYPRDLVVNVSAGTGAPTWWRLTAPVTTIGVSDVTFSQIL